MKKRHIAISLLSIVLLAITTVVVWGESSTDDLRIATGTQKSNTPKVAIAYVEDFRKGLPDPNMFTQLVYAFAEFNDECDGVVIKYPEKLKAMADLKNQNPALKVILGIGGYKKEGFSEMTGDKKKRKSFVKDVTQIIDSLDLDGVDLDWEFPTTDKGGHTASPDDDKNYALFVKDLRKSLGKKKQISYYSLGSGIFINHKKMLPYVDYVNVSGYNLVTPQEGQKLYHQSPLYSSEKLGVWSVKKSVEAHMKLGVPKEKILIGIPFFGRGKSPFPSYVDYSQINKYADGLKPLWDSNAQAPYYADKSGNLVLGYDNARSIAAKFDFIRLNDLPGIFVWNYDADTDNHELGKTIQRLRK